MQYFQDSNSQILNITDMTKVPQADCKNWNTTLSICEPLNPKTVAQCIPDPDETGRVCFDSIGTPVLTFAVFGGKTCEAGSEALCQACLIDAPAMQVTFLLQKNDYSIATAEEWERQVFIRNFKSFNKAMNNGYNDAMDGPM